MSHVAFADEAGTSGKTRCYAIGVLSLGADRVEAFERHFVELKKQHGVLGEAHWEKVKKSHGLVNFVLHWLHLIRISHTARFDVMVIKTSEYRKWISPGPDREEAFYVTYTQLLTHLARKLGGPLQVFIDDRPDSYPLQNEVVEVVGNYMLSKLATAGRLTNVTKVTSHESPGVQVADLLTGLFASAHRLHLSPDAPLHPGKRLTIKRAAQYLGWDALHYDTWQESTLNVWHFPTEYRGDPETKKIRAMKSPLWVSPGDLVAANTS